MNDKSIVNPFVVSSALVGIIKKHAGNIDNERARAYAIYMWIEENIDYGDKKRKCNYKNSNETLSDKEGICGEMAFLYIVMARCCGLRSGYVSVRSDCKGKKVWHGCAYVSVDSGNILVDPAYHRFDIKHKKYEFLDDSKVLRMFNEWREGS